ncbi:hypothetical protein HZ326_12494 [Fusarium oxysporum f. sp. albedinis]|nr:hypothetical protein HZ326_12494 [Fusarium oxysporum f. sp. albedinis]
MFVSFPAKKRDHPPADGGSLTAEAELDLDYSMAFTGPLPVTFYAVGDISLLGDNYLMLIRDNPLIYDDISVSILIFTVIIAFINNIYLRIKKSALGFLSLCFIA